MNIVKYPNTILDKEVPNFDFENPILDPVQLEKDMLDIMRSNNGIGLAANQVGIETKVFVMGNPNDPSTGQAFFNPAIVEVSQEVQDLEEGCLSFPNIFVKIKRPTKIKAIWQNREGIWEEGEFTGYACKCFLHEYDHLNGITFNNRVSQLKWALATKKSKNRK
jgi:peptide deformylase